jgi:hypothetical protein
MTPDPYAAADHDNYWERRRELAEGSEPGWPVCDQCGAELPEDFNGNPDKCECGNCPDCHEELEECTCDIIRVCCAPSCHRVIDTNGEATGERLDDATYQGHRASHGYCKTHHAEAMAEINQRRANRAA